MESPKVFHEQVMERFTAYLQSMQITMLGIVPHGLDPIDLMALYVDRKDHEVLLRAHELLGQRGHNEIVLAPYEGRMVTLEAALVWDTPGGFSFPVYMRGRSPLDTASAKVRRKLQDWTDASVEVACLFAYWELALRHLNRSVDTVEEILFFLPSLAFLFRVASEGIDTVGAAIERGSWSGNGNDWNRFIRQKGIVEKKLRPKTIPRMDGWVIDASRGADMVLAQWRMVADTPKTGTPIRLTLSKNGTRLPSPHTEDALIPML